MTLRLLALLCLSLVAFAACPPSGVVCRPGTEACGSGCIDPQSDKRNCGACGVACGAGRECTAGVCECRPGTALCDGSCVVLAWEPAHCGACGTACGAGEVCEAGTCQAACTVGTHARCGGSCVELARDVAHCGACGVACEQGQVCRAGQCVFEAVAACYWSGQVVGFSPSTGSKGPLSALGSSPAALASYGATLLAADGMDARLYQGVPAQGGYAQAAVATTVGRVPNQVLVDAPWVYVVNAQSGTLQVLKAGATAGQVALDAGVAPGVALGTVAEVSFGMNSYPQGAAKVGTTLYVPLYGGTSAATAGAGQAVARVDVTDPASPVLLGRVELGGLDLKAFDGGTATARPWAITAHGDAVYVTLNNLDADTYAPAGPGLLARLDTSDAGLAVIDLGADACLNPQAVGVVGGALAVSCAGKVTYTTSYAVASVTQAGLVVVTPAGERLSTWSPSCPADAGAACVPMLPGRLGVKGAAVLLADQNAGRVTVLEVTDAGVAERAALSLCPVSELTGLSNVADVVTP